nr:MAG TPA: Gamma-glutamyl hydrolase [Caudoviricetes sp.]
MKHLHSMNLAITPFPSAKPGRQFHFSLLGICSGHRLT